MDDESVQTPPLPEEDQPTTEPVDFFGFRRSEKFDLVPDGSQWMSFHAMNEGEKRSFQSKTTKDFVIDSKTRDTRVSVDPGTERMLLIETCIDDWHIRRGETWAPDATNRNGFKVAVHDFLTLADPSVVEKIEKHVRELNPWMLDQLTIEAIDDEIENLKKTRERLVERQRGEDS